MRYLSILAAVARHTVTAGRSRTLCQLGAQNVGTAWTKTGFLVIHLGKSGISGTQ